MADPETLEDRVDAAAAQLAHRWTAMLLKAGEISVRDARLGAQSPGVGLFGLKGSGPRVSAQ